MYKVFYTIGYGSRGLGEFLDLLDTYNIGILFDIRRFPKSKIPYYNRWFLEKTLEHYGIRYYWLGELLGGYRGGYQKYMETIEYRIGIVMLEKLAQQTHYTWLNPVIMCLEKHPRGCHRRYIAQTLYKKGYKVIHIIDKDMEIKHKE